MTTTTPQPSAAAPERALAHAASGKIKQAGGDIIVFAPTGTNYELQLKCPRYAGPVNKPVKGVIRAQARKVWTVPSGGGFITPIFGTPKIIQGWVKAVDSKWLLVQAGAPIVIELPDSDIVYDLANGPITVGAMVNVTTFAGASFEPLGG